jgi:hypothetical protein
MTLAVIFAAALLISGCATSKPYPESSRHISFHTSPDTSSCPKTSEACFNRVTSTIYMPRLKPGYYTVRYQQIEFGSLPCKRTLSCFKDGVLYNGFTSFGSSRLNELGHALRQATGIDISRNSENTLAHEFLHAVGFRHKQY